MAKIEIEYRSICSEDDYNRIMSFLLQNGEDLGVDDKDSSFYILEKKLLNIYDLDKRAVVEKVEKSLLSEDNMGYGLVRNYYERLSNRKEESLQMIFNSLV